jgi:hypothetical protein
MVSFTKEPTKDGAPIAEIGHPACERQWRK